MSEEKTSAEERRARTEQKKTFLTEWTLQNPLATMNDVKAALRERFGETMGTDLIIEAFKHARAVAQRRAQEGLQPAAAAGAAPLVETTHSINSIVAAMKAAGMKKIEVQSDGTFEVTFRSS